MTICRDRPSRTASERQLVPVPFPLLLEAFNCGYNRLGWAEDWPQGALLRWAYKMGRRQHPHLVQHRRAA